MLRSSFILRSSLRSAKGGEAICVLLMLNRFRSAFEMTGKLFLVAVCQRSGLKWKSCGNSYWRRLERKARKTPKEFKRGDNYIKEGEIASPAKTLARNDGLFNLCFY